MKRLCRIHWMVFLIAATSAAALLHTRALRAADTGFPIYFRDSTLTVAPQNTNRIVYLPLLEIVRHLTLAYTDATGLETFTIQGASSRLVLTRNSALISINDQVVLLQNPVLREEGRWLVPIDFLSQGLSRVAEMEFRYRPGTSRIFAGNVSIAELSMNAEPQGAATRLTIRAGRPIDLNLQRDGRRAILVVGSSAIDPLREGLDYRDPLVQSIAFDDADGVPKIVAEVTAAVDDIRITPADDRHVYFIDFLRPADVAARLPASGPPPPPPDPVVRTNQIRVIVIDPGHGGLETGTGNAEILEKDLTLEVARALRPVLQNRLGATVLLTRDSDITLSSEARAAVANNNKADLFISLHAGYSEDAEDANSSIYVMPSNFAERAYPNAETTRLFLPWYLGYRSSRQASEQAATLLQEELARAFPAWSFPLRSGPVAVLASTTMPSLALEVGNLNNPMNAQRLLEPAFRTQLATAVAAAVERFSTMRARLP